MNLLQLFADHLLPILLVAGAGYLLAAKFRLDARGLTSVAFNLFAPCLILQLILDSRVPATAVARMAGFAIASLALPALAMFALARWRRWSRTMTSAGVLCAMIPNSGNYGMSANLLAFGQEGLAQASVFFLASSIVTYTVGVLVASLGRARLGDALLGLLRVPTLWAVAAAFGLRLTHVAVPLPAERAIALMAAACIPTFLVILGIQLREAALKGPAEPLIAVAGMRMAGGMAAGFALAPLFGLSGAAHQAGVFQSSMPTAIITIILATEYDVEPAFVSSVVLLTTLLSPLALTPLLSWLT